MYDCARVGLHQGNTKINMSRDPAGTPVIATGRFVDTQGPVPRGYRTAAIEGLDGKLMQQGQRLA